MALQNKFGKKAQRPEPPPTPKTRFLSGLPTVDDLLHSVLQAHTNARTPMALSWKKPGTSKNYLLTVTCNGPDTIPNWLLHFEEGTDLHLLWSYATPDTELIFGLVHEDLQKEQQQPAVIPESLRPQLLAESADYEEEAITMERPAHESNFFEGYELFDVIGSGGMGLVYKARHCQSHDYVALKVLRADLLLDPANVARFKNEAEVAKNFDHPNLVGMKSYGVSQFGQPYLVMEYLDGVRMADILQERGLDLPVFLNIFMQICAGLAYAHEHGLIHRDLKPGNVIIVTEPNGNLLVKIIDFGIAKTFRDPSMSDGMTTTGQLLGSPAYMSPEQCGGAELDPRSDIYTIGTLMYEAITGLHPFVRSTTFATILAQVNERPQPLMAVRPERMEIEQLEDVIFQCLEKRPEDRYETVEQLSEDLWALAAGGGKEAIRRAKDVNARSTSRELSILHNAGVLSLDVLDATVLCAALVVEGKLTYQQAADVVRRVHSGGDFEGILKDALSGNLSS
ncbi:MAG: serine/threonine-protein kinase [Candidatus Obscuribacterales bacterium]